LNVGLYGDTEVYVTIDMKDLLSVAEPTLQVPLLPPKELVNKALAEPRGSKKLEELVGLDCTVAMAVEGTTRPINAIAALASIVTQLVNLIVPKEKITIIVANGVRERSNDVLVKALKASDELREST
jgi:nickel-dependent lactate racemase